MDVRIVCRGVVTPVEGLVEKGNVAKPLTPAKLGLEHPALTKIAGDFHDAASVRAAVAGHDAVIITASLFSDVA